jgi:hypothetical protein
MNRLAARYDLHLSHGLVLRRAENDYPSYTTTMGEFEVVVSLRPNAYTSTTSKNGRYLTHHCRHIRIHCSRPDTERPPFPLRTSSGECDYSNQTKYFECRKPPYARAAATVASRFLVFHKYVLHQPFISHVDFRHVTFQNPVWMDEAGVEVGKQYVFSVAHDLHTSFGVTPVRKSLDGRVQRSLKNDYDPKLHEELLANALNAAFSNNLRLAVIELAMACEVAIRYEIPNKTITARPPHERSPALRASSHDETTLIDTLSETGFGRGFSGDQEREYNCIQELLQCRAEVTFSGRLQYSDQQGIVHNVTSEILEAWFEATHTLIKWLKALR